MLLLKVKILQEYLKATGTFNLEEAFPNLASHPYHWRVDPYETNRYICMPEQPILPRSQAALPQ